jgi:hypothetical protein
MSAMTEASPREKLFVGISEKRKEQESRAWRFAFLAAFVVHVMVFILWPAATNFLSPFAAAGPRMGDNAAAAGGLQSLNVRTPTPRPINPPLVPILTTDPIELDPIDEEIVLETAQLLGERPGDDGPGLADGEGQGDGGTAAEGLFRLMPPSPRGMIIPPSHPSLKDRRVEVWVFVDERGRAIADSTFLKPPTDDGDLNKRLIREASEWIFSPAKKGGRAVAAWFPYTISTGGGQ